MALVYVVDDHVKIRELLEGFLAAEEHQVCSFANGGNFPTGTGLLCKRSP